MPFDVTKFVGEIQEYIGRAVSPLAARIKALEDRPAPDLAPLIAEQSKAAVAALPVPKDGKSVSVEDVAPLIADQVKSAVAALPPAAPGKDADPIDVKELMGEIASAPEVKLVIDAMVAEALAPAIAKALPEAVAKALPDAVAVYLKANPPKDGVDGTSVAPEAVAAMVSEQVKSAVSAIPPPKNGADGVGLAGALIDRNGELVITLTNGAVKSLGKIVGKDGDRGNDGLSMEAVTRTYDADAHEVVERWAVGGVAKELRYPAGGIRPGGFWNEGEKTLAMQVKTHDGHAWVALRDTTAKPSTDNPQDWQLFVRRGTPGRDLRDAKAPEPVKLGTTNA